MSWQATAWADSLPYDIVGPLAYRVLIKLANVAGADGTAAWRTKADIARELGVSERSVQRAYRDLEILRLVLPGDQEYVRHFRVDKRPKVYDLNLRYAEQYAAPELEGFEDESGETGLSTGTERGDTLGANGETTVVAQGTIQELPTKTSQRNHTAPVSPLIPAGYEPVAGHIPCTGGSQHQYEIGSDDETPCRRCGYIRYQLERDNREHRDRQEAKT